MEMLRREGRSDSESVGKGPSTIGMHGGHVSAPGLPRQPITSPGTALFNVMRNQIPKTLFDDGYAYRINTYPRAGQTRANYRCWRYKASKCSARISYDVVTGTITSVSQEHRDGNCNAELLQKGEEMAKELAELKEKVQHLARMDPGLKANGIQQMLLLEAKGGGRDGRLPVAASHRQIQTWITEVRQRVPDGLLQEMDDPYTRGTRRKWVRSQDTAIGMVIFMTDLHEQMMASAAVWQVDGTFKAAPRQFQQLLNVMAVDIYGKRYLPVCHVLLTSGTYETYFRAFSRILDVLERPRALQVRTVITDFEPALKRGVEDSLSGRGVHVRVQGCLFHFAQAILRKFRKLYARSPISFTQKRVLSILVVLPYLPLQSVKTWVAAMRSKETGCDAMLDYVRTVWLTKTEWWWVGPDTPGVFTNCALEGFHGNLRHYLDFAHPSIDLLSTRLYEMDMDLYYRQQQDREQRLSRGTEWLTRQARVMGNLPSIEARMEDLLLLPDKREAFVLPMVGESEHNPDPEPANDEGRSEVDLGSVGDLVSLSLACDDASIDRWTV